MKFLFRIGFLQKGTISSGKGSRASKRKCSAHFSGGGNGRDFCWRVMEEKERLRRL